MGRWAPPPHERNSLCRAAPFSTSHRASKSCFVRPTTCLACRVEYLYYIVGAASRTGHHRQSARSREALGPENAACCRMFKMPTTSQTRRIRASTASTPSLAVLVGVPDAPVCVLSRRPLFACSERQPAGFTSWSCPIPIGRYSTNVQRNQTYRSWYPCLFTNYLPRSRAVAQGLGGTHVGLLEYWIYYMPVCNTMYLHII